MIFKKCTVLFLAFLLLVSNIGVALSIHYCGGNIASIGVYDREPQQKDEDCCAIMATANKKCCSEKVITIDDNSDQLVLKVVNPDVDVAVFVATTNYIFLFNRIITSKGTIAYYCDSTGPPLFQLFKQYIFYA